LVGAGGRWVEVTQANHQAVIGAAAAIAEDSPGCRRGVVMIRVSQGNELKTHKLLLE
jgi:hypothetical protein